MKKLLKIMSVLTLTTIISLNVSACEFFENHSNDWNQQLADAAKLISNDRDLSFNTFLTTDSKTHISDFTALIKKNISNLFTSCGKDYSSILYRVTNGDDEIKPSVNIKIHLWVTDSDNNPIADTDCSFDANFSSLQTYIDKKMQPLVIGKETLSINKNDKGGFYKALVDDGATFHSWIPEQLFTTSTKGGADFWERFQNIKTKDSLLANVLYPILTFIGDVPFTGLTFDNFKPILENKDGHNNVIAITGNKKFDGKAYDYIKIAIEGVKTDTTEFGNTYKGLTFIFT